jgi:hypothetical protein
MNADNEIKEFFHLNMADHIGILKRLGGRQTSPADHSAQMLLAAACIFFSSNFKEKERFAIRPAKELLCFQREHRKRSSWLDFIFLTKSWRKTTNQAHGFTVTPVHMYREG